MQNKKEDSGNKKEQWKEAFSRKNLTLSMFTTLMRSSGVVDHILLIATCHDLNYCQSDMNKLILQVYVETDGSIQVKQMLINNKKKTRQMFFVRSCF